MMRKYFGVMVFLIGAVFLPIGSEAAVQTKIIPYTHGETQLEGLLAWDDHIQGKRPGVLVVHEWWGLNDYARQRAEQLAALGYVAFAVDMYGKDKVTTHPDQAGTWMIHIQSNVNEWQARAITGLEVLRNHPLVASGKIAAIGYCFGGATVMQLAYSGTDIQGVVSFHGSLPLPENPHKVQTQAKVLIAHGNADSFVPENHVQKFRKAVEEAKLDWQMVVFSGTRHSFTNPGAGTYGIDALKYDANADKRSWVYMQAFFQELFQ